MIELMIHACLISNPSVCDNFKVDLYQTKEYCQVSGIAELADWSRRTGDMWYIMEFRCSAQ